MSYKDSETLFDALGLEFVQPTTLYDAVPKPEKEVSEDDAAKLKAQSKLQELIENGWREFYDEIFPEDVEKYGRKFSENLAPHHAESLEWHWESRLALIKGEKPEYWAYFPIWSRGHMKSTLARRVVIVDALLSFAFDKPAYILYVSRNKTMVEKHSSSIETMLGFDKVREYCPQLSQVKKNTQGHDKGWQATFLNTKANVVFHFGSLEEGLAGGNVDDVRPTLILPDDIDGRENSPYKGEVRLEKLTTEVLPMRQSNTLTFWAQNLINRYSAMYQIQSNKAQVLTNRKPTQPIPACYNPVYDKKTVKGIVKWFVKSCDPTWEYFDLDRINEEIETIGLPAFKRECLHEVEQSREGLLAFNFDDNVHPISESEFAAIYGSKTAWKGFNKWSLNDYALTKTEKHANVAGYLCVSNQNSKLPGHQFLIPFSFPDSSSGRDVAERLLSELQPFAYDNVTWTELRKATISRSGIEKHARTDSEAQNLELAAIANVIPTYSRPVLKKFRVVSGVMSHSEDRKRKIYNRGYGFNFAASNPGMLEGIEDYNNDLEVDYDLDNPFRPGAKGYTRWHVICPDKTEEEDGTAIEPVIINGIAVYPPKEFPKAVQPHELHDSDLFRYQMKNWRMRIPKSTEAGEQVDMPLKENDDYGQMLQMFYIKNLLRNIPLNESEQIERDLPESLKQITIENIEDVRVQDLTLQARLKKITEMKQENNRPVRPAGLHRFRKK